MTVRLEAKGLVADRMVVLTLPLAAIFWIVAFLWTPISFWILMALATGILGLLALAIRGPFLFREGLSSRDILVGVASGALLYGVFWVGHWAITVVLPFAPSQVTSVYELKDQASPLAIGLLMALVIGPGEELYWRGLIQETAARRWGKRGGWTVGVLAYGGVHILTGNLMVVIAALVGGVVWGALYAREGRILPVILSHTLWDLTIFLWLPLN